MKKYNPYNKITSYAYMFLTIKLKHFINEYENNFKNKISKLNDDEKLFFNKIVFYAAMTDLFDYLNGRKNGK